MKIKKIMTGIIATLLSVTTFFQNSAVYACGGASDQAEQPPESKAAQVSKNPADAPPVVSSASYRPALEPTPIPPKDSSHLEELLFDLLPNYYDVMQCRLCQELEEGKLDIREVEMFFEKEKQRFIQNGMFAGRNFFEISEYNCLGTFIPPITEAVDHLVLGAYLRIINDLFEAYPGMRNSLFHILLCGFKSESDRCFKVGIGCSRDYNRLTKIKGTDGKEIDKIKGLYIEGNVLGLELHLGAHSFLQDGGTTPKTVITTPKSVSRILSEYLNKKQWGLEAESSDSQEVDNDERYYMLRPTCPFYIIAEPAIRAMSAVFYQIAFLHYAAAKGGLPSFYDLEKRSELKCNFRGLVAKKLGYDRCPTEKEFADHICCALQMLFSDDPDIKSRGERMLWLLKYLEEQHRNFPYSTLEDPVCFE